MTNRALFALTHAVLHVADILEQRMPVPPTPARYEHVLPETLVPGDTFLHPRSGHRVTVTSVVQDQESGLIRVHHQDAEGAPSTYTSAPNAHVVRGN